MDQCNREAVQNKVIGRYVEGVTAMNDETLLQYYDQMYPEDPLGIHDTEADEEAKAPHIELMERIAQLLKVDLPTARRCAKNLLGVSEETFNRHNRAWKRTQSDNELPDQFLATLAAFHEQNNDTFKMIVRRLCGDILSETGPV